MSKPRNKRLNAKNSLSKHIRIFLSQRNWSQTEAAEAIGMAAPTFRVRLSKNKFRRDEISAIKAKLNLDLPDDGSIDFGPKAGENSKLLIPSTTLAEALRHADVQRKSLDVHLDRFGKQLVPLVAVMKKWDIMVVSSSSVTPLEFGKTADTSLIEAFVEAIRNGATFIYIRPDAEYIRDNLIRLEYDMICTSKAARDEARVFRRKVTEILIRNHSLDENLAEKKVAAQVLDYESHRSPFWAAGFCMTMIHTVDARRVSGVESLKNNLISANPPTGPVLRRMMIRVPGSGRALLQPASYERFARRFNTWVVDVLEQQIRNSPELSELLNPLIDSMSEKGVAD